MATLQSLSDGFRPNADDREFEWALSNWAPEIENLAEPDRIKLIELLFTAGFDIDGSASLPRARRELVQESLVEFYTESGGGNPKRLGIADVSLTSLKAFWPTQTVLDHWRPLMEIVCSIDWQPVDFSFWSANLLDGIEYLASTGNDQGLLGRSFGSLQELILVSRQNSTLEEIQKEAAMVAERLRPFATQSGRIGCAARPARRQALLACAAIDV